MSLRLRQRFRIIICLDFKNPWKWKWSNEVEKSEMSMIWCISITNNVKSYKKVNEIAQTARFTVFTMCGSWKSWFFMKTSQTESHFWPLYTLVWLYQGNHVKGDVQGSPKMWYFFKFWDFKPELWLLKVGSNLKIFLGRLAALKKKTRPQFSKSRLHIESASN